MRELVIFALIALAECAKHMNLIAYDAAIKYSYDLHDMTTKEYQKTAKDTEKRLTAAFKDAGYKVNIDMQEYILANEGPFTTQLDDGSYMVTSVNVANGESICDRTQDQANRWQQEYVGSRPLMTAVVSVDTMDEIRDIMNAVRLDKQQIFIANARETKKPKRKKRSMPYIPFNGISTGGPYGGRGWPMPPFAVNQKCKNGGYKIWSNSAIGGNFVCSCPFGYYGSDCRFILCQNGGIASYWQPNTGMQATAYCHCPPGFNGQHCEAVGCKPKAQSTFQVLNSAHTFAVAVTRDDESLANALAFAQGQKMIEQTDLLRMNQNGTYTKYTLTSGYSGSILTNADPNLVTVVYQETYTNIDDMINALENMPSAPYDGTLLAWDTITILSTAFETSSLGAFENMYYFVGYPPTVSDSDACMNTIRRRMMAFRTPIYTFIPNSLQLQQIYYCYMNGPPPTGPCIGKYSTVDLSLAIQQLPAPGSYSFFEDMLKYYWEMTTYSGGQFIYLNSTMMAGIASDVLSYVFEKDSLLATGDMHAGLYGPNETPLQGPGGKGDIFYKECNIAKTLTFQFTPRERQNTVLGTMFIDYFGPKNTVITLSSGASSEINQASYPFGFVTPDQKGVMQFNITSGLASGSYTITITPPADSSGDGLNINYPCSVRVRASPGFHYYTAYTEAVLTELSGFYTPEFDVIDATAPWAYYSTPAINTQPLDTQVFNAPVFATSNLYDNITAVSATIYNAFDLSSTVYQSLAIQQRSTGEQIPCTYFYRLPGNDFDCSKLMPTNHLYQNSRDYYYFPVLVASKTASVFLSGEIMYGYCDNDNSILTSSPSSNTDTYNDIYQRPINPVCYNGGTYSTANATAFLGTDGKTPLVMPLGPLNRCICTDLWVGSKCDVPRCLNYGILTEQLQCSCRKGFYGAHCEYTQCNATDAYTSPTSGGGGGGSTFSLVYLTTSTMNIDISNVIAVLTANQAAMDQQYINFRYTWVYQTINPDNSGTTRVEWSTFFPANMQEFINGLMTLPSTTTSGDNNGGFFNVDCSMIKKQPIYYGIAKHLSVPDNIQKFYPGSPTYVFVDQRNADDVDGSATKDVVDANQTPRSPLIFFITDAQFGLSPRPTNCSLNATDTEVQNSYGQLAQQSSGQLLELFIEGNATGNASNYYYHGGKDLIYGAFTDVLHGGGGGGGGSTEGLTQSVSQGICTMTKIGPIYASPQTNALTIVVSYSANTYVVANDVQSLGGGLDLYSDIDNLVFETVKDGKRFTASSHAIVDIMNPDAYTASSVWQTPIVNFTAPNMGTATAVTLTNSAGNIMKTGNSFNGTLRVTYTFTDNTNGVVTDTGSFLYSLKQASYYGGFYIYNAFSTESVTVKPNTTNVMDPSSGIVFNTVQVPGPCSYNVYQTPQSVEDSLCATSTLAKNKVSPCQCGGNNVQLVFVTKDDVNTFHTNPIYNTPMQMMIFIQPDDIYMFYNGTQDRSAWPMVAEVRVFDPASKETSETGVLYAITSDRSSNRTYVRDSMPSGYDYMPNATHSALNGGGHVCMHTFWVDKPIQCTNLDDVLTIQVLVQVSDAFWEDTKPSPAPSTTYAPEAVSTCHNYAPTYPISYQPRVLTVTCNLPQTQPVACLNGGAPSTDGTTCNCVTGWTGNNCERPVTCANNATYLSTENLCDCNGAASYLAANLSTLIDRTRPDAGLTNPNCTLGYCQPGTPLSIGGQRCDMNACPQPNYSPKFQPTTKSFVLAYSMSKKSNAVLKMTNYVADTVASAVEAGYTRFVFISAVDPATNIQYVNQTQTVFIDTNDPVEFINFYIAITASLSFPITVTGDVIANVLTYAYGYSNDQGVIWLLGDTLASPSKYKILQSQWAISRVVVNTYVLQPFGAVMMPNFYQAVSRRSGGNIYIDLSTYKFWNLISGSLANSVNQQLIYSVYKQAAAGAVMNFSFAVDALLDYVVVGLTASWATMPTLTSSAGGAISYTSCAGCQILYNLTYSVLFRVPVTKTGSTMPGIWTLTYTPDVIHVANVAVYGSTQNNFLSLGYVMQPWLDFPATQPVWSELRTAYTYGANNNYFIVNFNSSGLSTKASKPMFQLLDLQMGLLPIMDAVTGASSTAADISARLSDQQQPNFCAYQYVSAAWMCPVSPLSFNNGTLNTYGFFTTVSGTDYLGNSFQRMIPAYCYELAQGTQCTGQSGASIGQCSCAASSNPNDWRFGPSEYYGTQCTDIICVNGGTPVRQGYNGNFNLLPNICACPTNFAGPHCDKCATGKTGSDCSK